MLSGESSSSLDLSMPGWEKRSRERQIETLTKKLRERQNQHKKELINRVSAPAAVVLKSFSVIFLSSIGFSISSNQLLIKCTNCPCEYTADEMEEEGDDVLNFKHIQCSPKCRVLLRILNDFEGRLRLPGANQPQPQQQQGYGYQAAHSYVHQSLPAPAVTKQSTYQDDIVSDSYPGVHFTGSGPSSHENQSGSRTSRSSSRPDNSDYQIRLASFGTNWKNRAKKKSRPSPKELAEAGLYEYTQERKDAAKCYACNTVLYGWKGNDDVWKKHAQNSPSCTHVVQHKGRAYIDEVNAQKPRRPATMQNLLDLGINNKWVQTVMEMGFSLDDLLLVALYRQHLEPSRDDIFTDIQDLVNMLLYKKSEAENNFARFRSKWPTDDDSQDVPESSTEDGDLETDAPVKYEETQCRICFSAQAQMFLGSCSHLVTCESCTKQLKNCPLCRKPITDVKKVF